MAISRHVWQGYAGREGFRSVRWVRTRARVWIRAFEILGDGVGLALSGLGVVIRGLEHPSH